MGKKRRNEQRGGQHPAKEERDDRLTIEGSVEEALPGTLFRIKCDTGHEALCTLSGKLRYNRIRLCIGDRVKCEFSPYDVTRGRIVWRM